MARPSLPYDSEIADEICERIATTVLGLEDIVEAMNADGIATPSVRVIYRWLSENPEFQQKSARARELQGDTLADLAMKHALTPMVGTSETTMEWGVQVKTGDNVARSQLIVQTILKRAGQLAPKKYGDKVSHEHAGTLTLESLIAGARKPQEGQE